MDLGSTTFWVGLAQIIGVNIVLSGDNAVVIALAARALPLRQQRRAVFWGSGAAVALRVLLAIVAVELLQLPYLKFVGAALLLWIGIKLLLPEDDGGNDPDASSGAGLGTAIRTILTADLVMSLDNVIAVAAAAKGSLLLLIIGLAISIPLVVFGSTLLITLMQHYAFIITIGAALIGWVAGDMAVTDPLIEALVDTQASWLHLAGPLAGAVLVVGVGKWCRVAGRSARKQGAPDASSNRSV
jgi:YjbE family integral membrane protein